MTRSCESAYRLARGREPLSQGVAEAWGVAQEIWANSSNDFHMVHLWPTPLVSPQIVQTWIVERSFVLLWHSMELISPLGILPGLRGPISAAPILRAQHTYTWLLLV